MVAVSHDGVTAPRAEPAHERAVAPCDRKGANRVRPEGENSVTAAEEHGVENYPLYQWTKATIENPAKKEKYLKSFTLYVDDREVYAKEVADALEAALQPLSTSGLITRISKYDTNPANNPQSPQRPRERP
ncbi:hypothetical protein AC629_39905 [Bradyrhizobium sp. NAS80.1]|nr:hypothetical protein AC629_39905 [Bradyrhizobium sp. NAS80.1]